MTGPSITCPSREWLQNMAEIEDATESVSVGGLVADLDLLKEATMPSEPQEQLDNLNRVLREFGDEL